MACTSILIFMKRHTRHGLLITCAVLIPLLGYALMHVLIYIYPLSQESHFLRYTIYTLALIVLGLVIPYAMLKAGVAAAKLRNPDEKSLEIKDIPKDKDELAETMKH